MVKKVNLGLRWDPSYIKTIPGMLKIGQVILDSIVFICVMCSGSYFRNISTGAWTDFVAMTGFWVSGILLIFYLLHVMEKFHVIPWLTIEMGFCCLWSFFFFTCSIHMAVQAGKHSDDPVVIVSIRSRIIFWLCSHDCLRLRWLSEVPRLALGLSLFQKCSPSKPILSPSL